MEDRKKRILVMDDEENIRRAFKRMLSLEFDVVTVEDRFEAVNVYAASRSSGEPFALVVLDMEGKHERNEGMIAVQNLLKIDQHVKAVLHSSRASQFSENEIRSFGFAGAIQKAQLASDYISLIRSFL